MAIHSSILAWNIPQTEETSGLIVHGGHKELDTTELTTVYLHALCILQVLIYY